MAIHQLYSCVAFAEVPGWFDDDVALAWPAFRASCGAVGHRGTPSEPKRAAIEAALIGVCAVALAMPESLSSVAARTFFQDHFVPHRVTTPSAAPMNSNGNSSGNSPENASGLLTAYYEPVLDGTRTPSAAYSVPLHRRPPDLVNLVDEADRGIKADALTHMRRMNDGAMVPFPTRQEIDSGALAGQGLELFYVRDEVERFFLQVQGSGVIQLPDGERVRVGYDGKNGHPYTSVGRVLIDSGLMGPEDMSLASLGAWLHADPDRGRRAIWQNKSYVFFRAMPGAAAPQGVIDVALTPLRSLAIDPGYHALGLPIFVDAPSLTHITGRPFRQLLIGQDVGSAIRGPERGDIFAGSGAAAGRIAGITKHPGHFYVLLPRASYGAVRAP